MTLIIDETPVTFTLENEKNVEDLIHAINEHVKIYYSYVQSVEVDGQQYNANDQNSSSLDTVNTLRVHTAHIHELYLAKLELLQEILAERMQSTDDSLLSRLNIDADEITSIAASVLPEETALTLVDELTKKNDPLVHESLLKTIQHRIQSLHDPLASCKNALKALGHTLEAMQEGPVKLQAGDIQAVVKELLAFSELMQDIIRSYLLCTHRFQSLQAIDFSSIQTQLQELKQTLSEKEPDIVMLSDLIEYEIIPTGKEWIAKTHKNLDVITHA